MVQYLHFRMLEFPLKKIGCSKNKSCTRIGWVDEESQLNVRSCQDSITVTAFCWKRITRAQDPLISKTNNIRFATSSPSFMLEILVNVLTWFVGPWKFPWSSGSWSATFHPVSYPLWVGEVLHFFVVEVPISWWNARRWWLIAKSYHHVVYVEILLHELHMLVIFSPHFSAEITNLACQKHTSPSSK